MKALALGWAQANGFAICATEVHVPRSGYRADVAAIGRGPGRRAALFECKQARADLLKDAPGEAATRRELEALLERRGKLEELIAVHRPDLRRSDALWPEYASWDFTGLEHRSYQAVLAEIETRQRRVLRGMKFSKLFRYRSADFLYLVVEAGIIAAAEIPAGWGLLERERPTEGAEEALRLVRAPVRLETTEDQRSALLESIAVAATRAVNRAAGIGAPHPRHGPKISHSRGAADGVGPLRVAGMELGDDSNVVCRAPVHADAHPILRPSPSLGVPSPPP